MGARMVPRDCKERLSAEARRAEAEAATRLVDFLAIYAAPGKR